MNCSICGKRFSGPPFATLPIEPGTLPIKGSIGVHYKGYPIRVHFGVEHFSVPAMAGLAFCKECLHEAAIKAFNEFDGDLIIRNH